MKILYGLFAMVGSFALISSNINLDDKTADDNIEIISKVQVKEMSENYEQSDSMDLFNVDKGNLILNYENPNITYEMQEAETIANVGLVNKVGTHAFNEDEINKRNSEIATGENLDIPLFSVIKPTMEVPKYPITLNFEKINEFSYSPFYFNSDKLKITSNDKYVVYLYNSEDECVASVLSENGNVEINTTNLDNYYILIFNESEMESISMKLSVE